MQRLGMDDTDGVGRVAAGRMHLSANALFPLVALALLSCTGSGTIYSTGGDAEAHVDSGVADAAGLGLDAWADASPGQPDAAPGVDAAPVLDAAPLVDAAWTWNGPDFTLLDRNPSSPSYQQNRTLSANLGKVTVIYVGQFS